MKTLGIIGGIAPESTIAYYRHIVSGYRTLRPDGSYPPVLINSIDMTKMLGFVAADELGELTGYLLSELQKLVRAGAEFGLLASNTPHIVFDDLKQRSPIPLISIVEAACAAASELGIKRAGLFGTRSTMQGRFYPDVFAQAGITLLAPETDEQAYIHDKYMNELVLAKFFEETRQGLLAIVNRMKERSGIEAVVLGGTELPLILHDAGGTGIQLLDTGRIHAEAAVTRMLA